MGRIFETPLIPYQRSPDQDAAKPVRRKAVSWSGGAH